MKNKHLLKTLSKIYDLYSKEIKAAILKDFIEDNIGVEPAKPIINIAKNEDEFLPF